MFSAGAIRRLLSAGKVHRDWGATAVWTAAFWLSLVSTTAALSAAAASTTPAAEYAAEYVQASSEQLRATADNVFLTDRATKLEDLARSGLPLLDSLRAVPDASTRNALLGVLQANAKPVVDSLRQAAADQAHRDNELVDKWKEARAAIYEGRQAIFHLNEQNHFAGQLVFLLGIDNRWFWLFGLAAIGTLAAVVVHERRHDVRRRLNGGKARDLGLSRILAALLLLLALSTLATFVSADRIYMALRTAGVRSEAPPAAQADKELQEVKFKRDAAKEELTKAKAKHDGAREAFLLRIAPVISSDDRLAEQWKEAVLQLQAIAASSLFQVGVIQQLEEDVKLAESVRQELDAAETRHASYYLQRELIRFGLGAALLGLVAVGGVLFHRGIRRRRYHIRNTCPLCLAEGTFEIMANGHPGTDSVSEMIQCKNLISEDPYEECEFTFLTMYREMPKICFPTLGIPQAGKTHWVSMVYRELTKGNYPRLVQFAKVRSTATEDFDRVVDEVINKRISPMATQTDRIPRPLVFNFLDRDRFGQSNMLVNIFDYSGEVVRHMTLQDRQRRRALDGDGFLFFLDPTYPAEEQALALANFAEDLHSVKGVKIGNQIHTPVALCVSKIDLLPTQPYAEPGQNGVIGDFYRDLADIGWELSLSGIARRSEAIAALRETIWPGWQIQRQIHDLFGGRYKFFPLTPIGLDGAGENDLSQRVIAPLGLLEPLLWLLHMNGYPIFR